MGEVGLPAALCTADGNDSALCTSIHKCLSFSPPQNPILFPCLSLCMHHSHCSLIWPIILSTNLIVDRAWLWLSVFCNAMEAQKHVHVFFPHVYASFLELLNLKRVAILSLLSEWHCNCIVYLQRDAIDLHVHIQHNLTPSPPMKSLILIYEILHKIGSYNNSNFTKLITSSFDTVA